MLLMLEQCIKWAFYYRVTETLMWLQKKEVLQHNKTRDQKQSGVEVKEVSPQDLCSPSLCSWLSHYEILQVNTFPIRHKKNNLSISYMHLMMSPPSLDFSFSTRNITSLAAGPSFEGLYYELWKNNSMPTTDEGKKKNPVHKRGLISSADWR